VVFSVLGGTKIGSRAGTIPECEAGVNDPAGIALMIGMIELATHPDASFTVVIVEFAVEMAVGLALGFATGRSRPSSSSSASTARSPAWPRSSCSSRSG
jgi:potassium/hydrogen antiporter